MRDGSSDRRPFSKLKLYIGEIGNNRKGDLMRIFDKYGPIKSFYVDDAKRFGFVEYVSSRDATEALRRTDGKNVNGARIRVEFARKDNRPPDFRKNNADRRHYNQPFHQKSYNHDRRQNFVNRQSPQHRSLHRRRSYNQKQRFRSRSNDRRSLSLDSRVTQFPPNMQLPGLVPNPTNAGNFISPFPYTAAFDPYAAFQMGFPLAGAHASANAPISPVDVMQNAAQMNTGSSDQTKCSTEERRKRRRRGHRSNSDSFANPGNSLTAQALAPDSSVNIEYSSNRKDVDNSHSNTEMLQELDGDDDRRTMTLSQQQQQQAAANLMNSPYFSMFHAMYPGFLPISPGNAYPTGFPNHPMMMQMMQQSNDNHHVYASRHGHHKNKRRKHHEKKGNRHVRRYKRSSHTESDHKRNHRKYRSQRERTNYHNRESNDSSSSYSSKSASYSCDDHCNRSNAEESETEKLEGRRKRSHNESFDDSSPAREGSIAESSPQSNSIDTDFRDKRNDNEGLNDNNSI